MQGNQTIHLQRAEGDRCKDQSGRSSKISEARPVVKQTQNWKIETQYSFIRLNIPSSTYLSIKSIQMDIFRQQIPKTSQGRRIFHKVGFFLPSRANGLPEMQFFGMLVPRRRDCVEIQFQWPTYMPIYIQTYLPTYLPACMHVCRHTYIHACMCACMHTYINAYTHTYIHVVNFDALAQASDFRIERRQVVLLCWMQDTNPEGIWNPISSRLNVCWQTDWAIEDQTKTWIRQPVPMISKHSAHLTPLPFGIRTWLWRYTYLLLLISMLWHRQAIFESKGDKLSSSVEKQDSDAEGLWNPISSRLNVWWQTDGAIEDQAKNLNSTARPYDHQAFSPSDPTAIWHSHLALAIYIFVFVNFDALAQASDFRIERRQAVLLCWMQDSNPEGLGNPISSRLNVCWQTDWAIEDQSKNLNSTARP